MNILDKKAYIFDFNGTMVFDSKMHENAWRYYIKNLTGKEVTDHEFKQYVHGRNVQSIFAHFIGQEAMSKEEFLKYALDKEAMYRKLCDEEKDGYALTRGLIDFLNQAKEKGVLLNIATASNKDNVDFYFRKFHLERWFDRERVVYDDETIKGKPDPDIYLRAMERLAVEPEDCVVFEDAVSGIVSAHAAGAGAIVGVYGDSHKEVLVDTKMVDLLIEDFTVI